MVPESDDYDIGEGLIVFKSIPFRRVFNYRLRAAPKRVQFQTRENGMTKDVKKQSKEGKRAKVSKAMAMINPDAAGIDVGASEHYVAVPIDRDEKAVRRFGAFTEDLHALAKWLLQCGVNTVAMESTGVYWIQLYQILESYDLKVKLVNAHHVKNVPGRKSDVQDCQWLQQLESFGLLKGSFRPEAKICVLRSYMRQRETLIRDASRHVQHMQKALTEMNIKLHQVISDITGMTGLAIIRAILAGERDRSKLAAMKDRRIKSDETKIAKSLEGDYRGEHLFALRQALDLYDYHQQKIAECDTQIFEHMLHLETRAAEPRPPAQRGRHKPAGGHHPFSFDCGAQLYRIFGVDLTRIDGINESTGQMILSELGLDLCQKWPTEAQFTSWLGLCPNNEITGGKVIRRGTRKVVNRVANALRMCAQSLLNSKSALGAYARRMRSKRDSRIAITATAHKLARMIYRMLKYGHQYLDIGQELYEAKYKDAILKSLEHKAKQLGYQLVANQPVPNLVP